jgi:two-component system, NarL family, response regulator NreC
MSLRILIVDDHGVVRAGLRALLNEESNLEVVGEAGTSDDGHRIALELRPDIVLMDLSIPGIGGLSLTRQLREELPETRVIILTVHEDTALLREAMTVGAAGYVVKRAVESELLAAIQAAVRGEFYIHPSMTRGLLETPRDAAPRPRSDHAEELTMREIDVVKLLTSGFTNRQIADQLFLSVRTVESHRARILGKLGLTSRAELVRWAVEKKLSS